MNLKIIFQTIKCKKQHSLQYLCTSGESSPSPQSHGLCLLQQCRVRKHNIQIFMKKKSTLKEDLQNWLDVFVVGMSILDLAYNAVPSWLVRLMRALRVVRLFGRISELRKMITAVSASIFAMLNAFVILVIMLCICACSSF